MNVLSCVHVGRTTGDGSRVTCTPRQGVASAAFLRTADTSKSSCFAVCRATADCQGFDYTTTERADACRLYKTGTQTNQTGLDTRKCVLVRHAYNLSVWLYSGSKHESLHMPCYHAMYVIPQLMMHGRWWYDM